MTRTTFSSGRVLTNTVERVPGTDCTVFFGRWDDMPNVWLYTLESDSLEEPVATGSLDLTGLSDTMQVADEQVARMVFLLEVEYAG